MFNNIKLILVLAALSGAPAAPAYAGVSSGSAPLPWDAGASDCSARPHQPLQIHAYDATTYILRENLCSTFEAPFLYLLIGQSRALLIDSGDVAEAAKAPLATTVMGLLPPNLPLLVVHTHRHLDHRAGDGQFLHTKNVTVVGYDLASVKAFYGFTRWPEGQAHIDLGGRIVDAIPTPGHNATEVSFYDRNTALFFSGDFLMPGRLLIDDAAADIASAKRAAAFLHDKPVSFVLGGHVEEAADGSMLPWESTYHGNERDLRLTKADVLALPAALQQFNGFYTQAGAFTMLNMNRVLLAFGVAGLVLIALFIWGLATIVIRFRKARRGLAR